MTCMLLVPGGGYSSNVMVCPLIAYLLFCWYTPLTKTFVFSALIGVVLRPKDMVLPSAENVSTVAEVILSTTLSKDSWAR